MLQYEVITSAPPTAHSSLLRQKFGCLRERPSPAMMLCDVEWEMMHFDLKVSHYLPSSLLIRRRSTILPDHVKRGCCSFSIKPCKVWYARTYATNSGRGNEKNCREESLLFGVSC